MQRISETRQESICGQYNGYNDITGLRFGTDPCGLEDYINKRLHGNDILEIINMTRTNISPALYAALQKCQPTSCAVERSFSMMKKIATKDRNFLPENLEKYVKFHFSNCSHQ